MANCLRGLLETYHELSCENFINVGRKVMEWRLLCPYSRLRIFFSVLVSPHQNLHETLLSGNTGLGVI